MSEILYNFAANANILDEIKANIASMAEVKEDMKNVFAVLSTVYTGQTATAFQQRAQGLSNQFDDLMNDMSVTQADAQQQQDMMHALDNHNAASM